MLLDGQHVGFLRGSTRHGTDMDWDIFQQAQLQCLCSGQQMPDGLYPYFITKCGMNRSKVYLQAATTPEGVLAGS